MFGLPRPAALTAFACWAAVALLLFGCGSSEKKDGGVTQADRGVDTGTPDAGDLDTGVPVDTGTPDLGTDAGSPDSGAPDLGSPDSGTPDTGVPGCQEYILRTNVCQELGLAAADSVLRCNPELNAGDVAHLATWLCAISPLLDPALTYSATAAAACACDLPNVPCTEVNPLASLSSCAQVVTGTIAVGDGCADPYRCVRGAYCRNPGGPSICAEPGTCEPLVPPGGDCTNDPQGCTAGHFCNAAAAPPICELRAALLDSCDSAPCDGESNALFFQTAFCTHDPKLDEFFCAPAGRANADCSAIPCHALYNCDSSSACVVKPGAGEACTTPIDSAAPSPVELADNALAAPAACRVPPAVSLGLDGFTCTQTGTTTGQATCLLLPGLGQACGFGQDLSPLCAPSTYCPGVETPVLMSTSCVAGLPPLDDCNADRDDVAYGSECAVGFCQGFKGSQGTCTDFCPGGT